MVNFWGLVLLGAAVLAVLLPYGITLLIALDTAYVRKERDTRKHISGVILAAAIFLNSVVIFLGHRVLLNRWNFLKTIKEVATLSFSYQQVKFFSLLLIGCGICAAMLGFALRWLLPKLLGKAYGRHFLTSRRRAALFFLAALIGMAGIGSMFFSFQGVENIVLNEIGGYNKSVGFGELGTICDFIELYNKGGLDCVVSQLYLSDDSANLKKWEIPGCTIPSGEYEVIPLYTADFAVSRNGEETIYLSDELGRILDSVAVPALSANISYSRTKDGTDVWNTVTQTPGESNDQARGKSDVSVQFSHEGGFYSDAFYLSLETQPGYDIYYTLDGSVPDTDAIRYEAPVYVYDKSAEPNVWRSVQRVILDWKRYTPDQTPVDKGFIIRAVAVAEDGTIGEVSTATYFINLPEYADKTVISLIADPEELFGEDGIYVTGREYDELYEQAGSAEDISSGYANFNKKGRSSEIPAHIEFFGADSQFYQDVGLRISGGSSRTKVIKRFSVHSRAQYSGNPVFAGTLFDGVTTRKIQIRAVYINGACQQLVADRAVGIQRGFPVIVFVNGEYWTDSYVLEKYDGHYFQEKYGVREDNVIVFKNDSVSDWNPEDMQLHDDIYTFLETHDLSDPENYAAFEKIVDIQSYIDFMCANIYMNNVDFSEDHNIVLWRARETSDGPYEDGKWRFALYDMDLVAWSTVEERVKINMFSFQPPFAVAVDQQALYVALTANPDFREQFVLSFMDMVNNNFQYETVAEILDAYDPEADNEEFHYFFRERAKYIVPYMAEEFDLTGSLETITLERNSNGGTVQLNTIVPDLEDGSWSGQYYTDYPVTVTAVPERGYRFVRWEGDITSTQPELEITLPAGGLTVKAVFEKEAGA